MAKNDIIHPDHTVTRGGKRYGCHCDAACNQEINACVLDDDHPDSCSLTLLPSGQTRRSKWGCPEWKPMPKAEQLRRERSEKSTIGDLLETQKIEAMAAAIREHQMAGRFTNSWDKLPNSQKKKWIAVAKAAWDAANKVGEASK